MCDSSMSVDVSFKLRRITAPQSPRELKKSHSTIVAKLIVLHRLKPNMTSSCIHGGSLKAQGGAVAPPLAGKSPGEAVICPFDDAHHLFD
ncbi:unnamed protein product [Prunus armeniaca]